MSTNREVGISWTDVTDNGNYILQFRNGDATTWTSGAKDFQENSYGQNTTSDTIKNLLDGEQYEVRMRTKTTYVTGPWTNTISDITNMPAPTTFQVEAFSSSHIELSWVDNNNNEDEYRLERREEINPGVWSSWQTIENTNPDTESYTDTGLDGDTTYEYRLTASNDT